MVSRFKISSCALPCSPNATGNNHSMGWSSFQFCPIQTHDCFQKKVGANTILGWLDSFNILCSRPGLWIEALQKVCIHGAGYHALCQHFRTKNTFSANIAPACKGKNNSNDHAMYINSWNVQGLSHAGENMWYMHFWASKRHVEPDTTTRIFSLEQTNGERNPKTNAAYGQHANSIMHACMHACMFVSIYLSMYLCIYVSMYLCLYVCVYVCLSVSVSVSVSVSASVSVSVCVYVCMHAWMDGQMDELMDACMHWFGLVWYGMVWHGIVWYGM